MHGANSKPPVYKDSSNIDTPKDIHNPAIISNGSSQQDHAATPPTQLYSSCEISTVQSEFDVLPVVCELARSYSKVVCYMACSLTTIVLYKELVSPTLFHDAVARIVFYRYTKSLASKSLLVFMMPPALNFRGKRRLYFFFLRISAKRLC